MTETTMKHCKQRIMDHENLQTYGDNEFWYESGEVEDVTICSNKFVGLSSFTPMFRLGPATLIGD